MYFGEQIARRNPTKRLGEPQDIGSFAAFLCSDAASWIHGSLLFVDGGTDALLRPDL